MKRKWDNIRYFLALARNKTLSGAGKELSVSHSTVQRRVAAFEQELNTHLFNKTASGYALTSEGEMLYREAEQVQSTLNSISRQISDADEKLKGEVVITTSDTLSYFLMPPIINAINKQFPELTIRLDMINAVTDLRNFEADIAIRPCPVPPADLIGRKVGSIKFIPCAAVDYINDHGVREFPQDTSNHRFVTLDSSYSDTPFYQWMGNRLNAQSQVTVTNGILSAVKLCASGLGIAFLPAFLLDHFEQLRPLTTSDEIFETDVWILSHADLRDTARVRVVRHFLLEHLAPHFTESS